jgi:hypothetical protein
VNHTVRSSCKSHGVPLLGVASVVSMVIENVVFHGVSGSSKAVSHSSLAGAPGLMAAPATVGEQSGSAGAVASVDGPRRTMKNVATTATK